MGRTSSGFLLLVSEYDEISPADEYREYSITKKLSSLWGITCKAYTSSIS